MIGQSVHQRDIRWPRKAFPRCGGLILLFLIVVLNDLVRIIPMAALVAVMIMVSIGTFSWRSILDLRRNPLPSSFVHAGHGDSVVATHDLAKGVIVGVLLSGIFFAGMVAKLFKVHRMERQASNTVIYGRGPDFLPLPKASSMLSILPTRAPDHHRLTRSHLWDITAVGALDKIIH